MREKAAELDILFLQNESAVLNGIKFVGTTLWTDYAINGDADQGMKETSDYNEFKWIRSVRNHRLTPQNLLTEHHKSREFLHRELQSEYPVYVVTHHAPHPNSIGKFSDDPALCRYVSDCSDLFEQKPVVWHHGHTHQSHDYQVGNTRVVCNPYGYYGRETNPAFNPQFVLDI